MRRTVEMAIWALLGVGGLLLLVGRFHHTFPFYPDDWSVTRAEALALALEAARDLGEPVEDALVVPVLATNGVQERRLRERAGEVPRDALEASLPAREVMHWAVHVYPPAARPHEWTYRVDVSPDGRVTSLRSRVPEDEALPDLDPAAARGRADAFLSERGFDLTAFGEPTVRRTELRSRTDSSVRFPARAAVLGTDVPYGVEVTFAGDRLTGFDTWVEDPREKELLAALQPINLFAQVRMMMPFLLFPFVVVPFLRRYHAGEVGVRRSVQLFLLSLAAGVLVMALSGASASQGSSFGLLSRRQVAVALSFQLIVFWFSALALIAALSWSVGEAFARERWPGKLAAFDALFQGRWTNATLARSSLRGVGAGLALAGGLVLLVPLLPGAHGEPTVGSLFGPFWQGGVWPGLGLLAISLVFALYAELFARLLLLSAWTRRFGRWGAGALVVVLSGFAFWPVFAAATVPSSILVSAAGAVVLVALFYAGDLLSALLAALSAAVAVPAMAFLLADDPFLQLQGALPLLLVALPMLVSVRSLFSGREFEYRWEDVPPHVRRIAERERQRVELETARRIQSSILPELPPSLHGVELAHAYLPASEVGGDFYDVLALEDGRLAVAVGDVAGHGVSSGLVMSMAKSALAVQVSFDPDVGAVFRTLNRTVYQTARRRLLATLCYAVIDPVRREMLFASAGHLFPYRIDAAGQVEALESVSYPLGVREAVSVLPREAHLGSADTLFLFSDGIVEARREGGDELFGFERLEAVLRRCGREPVGRLRDAVLEEVERFTGPAPREDDQTVLVLRLPE